MAEGRDVCGPLLTWDLTSGVTLAHVLHSLDSSWFNETWLGRIREDAEDNWRLKVSNLRKVLQSVLEYWEDVLGQSVSEHHIPDVSLAAQYGDEEQLGKLVQLVLGCAVSCQRREEHIQRIMTLEESVQHVVMAAIQELLAGDPPEPEPYETFQSQSRCYYFLSEEAEEVEGGAQQCCPELEEQTWVVQEQSQLEAEAGAAKKLLLLQRRLEELQEENLRLESGQEELRGRCQRLEREARELRERARELSGLAGEAKALRDERDALWASCRRAGRLEAAVRALRGRCAGAGELRRRARALEERQWAQQRRAQQLQAQLGRAQNSCKQLQAARRQVEELSEQRAEAAEQAQRWHQELQGLRQRFQTLTHEKERLLEERDALREANEELRGLRQADAALDGATSTPKNLAAEILPAELRETVTRLRRENRRLQEQRNQLQRRLEAKGTSLGDAEGEEAYQDPPSPPQPPALLALRNQLREKDALIRHLENDCERSRAQREREERLLVTAWYNMGLAVQQQQAKEVGGGGGSPRGPPESFLAQQRLATRRQRPPHGTPPNR